VELARAYCDIAEKRIEEAGLDCIVYNCAIEEFIHAGTYDSVLLCETIEHVLDPAVVLKKIWSLMNVGGVLFIATPLDKTRTSRRHYTVDTLVQALHDAGFDKMKARICYPDKSKMEWGVAQIICKATR